MFALFSRVSAVEQIKTYFTNYVVVRWKLAAMLNKLRVWRLCV